MILNRLGKKTKLANPNPNKTKAAKAQALNTTNANIGLWAILGIGVAAYAFSRNSSGAAQNISVAEKTAANTIGLVYFDGCYYSNIAINNQSTNFNLSPQQMQQAVDSNNAMDYNTMVVRLSMRQLERAGQCMNTAQVSQMIRTLPPSQQGNTLVADQ